jgi:hypothetical protein
MPSNEFFATRVLESNAERVEVVQGIRANPLSMTIMAAGMAIVLAVVVLLIMLKRRRIAIDDVVHAGTDDMIELSLEVYLNQIFADAGTWLNLHGATTCAAHAMSKLAESVTQNDGDLFTPVE